MTSPPNSAATATAEPPPTAELPSLESARLAVEAAYAKLSAWREKRSALLLTLAVFAGVASARAEIGWTYEQLAAKYVLDKDSRELLIDGGKGGWASYLVWTFGQINTSSGLTLPEWFIYTLSNRDKDSHSKLTPYQTCSAIAYERPNADLTEDDVQKLLAENACGQKWKAPTYDAEDKLWQWETEHKKGESHLAATWYTTSKDAVGLFPKCGYGSMTLEIVVNMGDNDLSKSPGEVP